LAGCLWTAPTDVLEPRLRGSVCDLLATAKLTGRLDPIVSLRPDAVKELAQSEMDNAEEYTLLQVYNLANRNKKF